MNTTTQTIEFTLPNAQRLYRVLDLVAVERARQAELLRTGAIPFDCADPDIELGVKLPVLIEEIGEVALAMQLLDRAWWDANPGAGLLQERLREELIQVAAVACAMAESLEDPAAFSPPPAPAPAPTPSATTKSAAPLLDIEILQPEGQHDWEIWTPDDTGACIGSGATKADAISDCIANLAQTIQRLERMS